MSDQPPEPKPEPDAKHEESEKPSSPSPPELEYWDRERRKELLEWLRDQLRFTLRLVRQAEMSLPPGSPRD